MISFAVIGSGFRAELFLRIARALHERFTIAGVVVRNEARRLEVQQRWAVPVFASVSELTRSSPPDFVVVAVRPSDALEVITELTSANLPVLTETPAAPDIPSLLALHRLQRAGAIIQVAEQYHLEPLIYSQIAIARSGLLGDVTEAFVSVAHDYHGMSVLRRMLGIGFEDAVITARSREFDVQAGPDRGGDPQADSQVRSAHTTAWLDFGQLSATYDFDDQQYRSFIRSSSVLVRGTRGELRDTDVHYLADYRSPVHDSIERIAAGSPGNHEGMFLRAFQLGEHQLYSNEFLPARLADDELAVATMLARMNEHVHGGPPVYDLAEAAQDQYLQLMMRQAINTGRPVNTERQGWAVP
ncbi:Gfo/Idh/MocA family oxidoreductase [Glaciihabitans sp. UYNi722]|uniref:Gfo/Idh/MocA family protein n=1 Tax=Glaciihabitans sp. UYNi722 TaxID=3156344 RepID=UPI0033943C0F